MLDPYEEYDVPVDNELLAIKPVDKSFSRAYHLYRCDAPRERKFLKRSAHRMARRVVKSIIRGEKVKWRPVSCWDVM